MGTLTGGHYTAHAFSANGWYTFDDSRLSVCHESKLKVSEHVLSRDLFQSY